MKPRAFCAGFINPQHTNINSEDTKSSHRQQDAVQLNCFRYLPRKQAVYLAAFTGFLPFAFHSEKKPGIKSPRSQLKKAWTDRKGVAIVHGQEHSTRFFCDNPWDSTQVANNHESGS